MVAVRKPLMPRHVRVNRCYARLVVISVLWISVFASVDVRAQNDEPTEENAASARASTSADEILQRFVNECVAITPGEADFPQKFHVGTQTPEEHELPFREVGLAMDFRIAKFETTQELYQAVMGQNPSRWQGPRNSVENVNFADAKLFCRKLTVLLRGRKLIATNDMVRLPTSVEWEYSCRAGTSTRYCFGDDPGKNGTTETLNQYAWHTGNAAGNDPAVGILKPNAWGLYDVHGYLWEFVSGDAPTLPAENTEHCLIRGGSWKDKHSRLSSSTYLVIPVNSRDDAVGFRCVIAEKPIAKNQGVK